MAGALKSLVATLTASAFLSGVSVLFGEENIDADIAALPAIVVVPKGGPWQSPGYAQGLDPSVEYIADTDESIDVYMRSFCSDADALAIDHADAVETLRQLVICAFADQRNQQNSDGSSAIGLLWRPTVGHWEMAGNQIDRFGRMYVMTFITTIAVPTMSPQLATVKSVTYNNAI